MGQGRGRPERGPRRRDRACGRAIPAPRRRNRAGATTARLFMNEKNRGQSPNSPLFVEDRGAVRILTMNRPEKRNALNSELTRALLDALRAADADESIGCVVLTGAGP